MKFTEEQKELLAFLPTELQNSKEITDSAKLVLGNIIFLYGMEEAQKNGYVYRTNQKMMEETGIKSEHTLIGAVRLLEILEYIKTKRGKRKKASTYELLINCSKTPQNCSNNCSKIETLQNQVLILQKQVVLLQKEIENLKNCSNNCSTDTETDKDIETKNNNNTKDIITKVDVTERKKENITKENVQDVKEKNENVIENESQQSCSIAVGAAATASLTSGKEEKENTIQSNVTVSPKEDVEIKKSNTQEKDSNNTYKSQHSVDRALSFSQTLSLPQPQPNEDNNKTQTPMKEKQDTDEVVSLINNIKKNVCAPMEEYRDSHNYHDFRVYHGYFLDSIKLLKKKCTSENEYNDARKDFAEWYKNEAKAFWKECQTLESQNRLYPNAPETHEMCREVQMYPKAV